MPSDRLPSVDAAAAGAAGIEDRLVAAERSGATAGLHGIVCVRGGRLFLERYYAGEDFSWAVRHGHVEFGPDTLHDLRSVTKSIVGLLYGIAAQSGLVPGPDARLYEQFSEYGDLDASGARADMRIQHVLTMSMGLAWDESLPYTDPANSEIAMEMSGDRCRYVLGRPLASVPGDRWCYCGGATAILGHLIGRGSGMTLPAFADERLFGPLEIRASDWLPAADRRASPASGLRLTPRDLALIGEVVLRGGVWNGQRVIAADWLERSLRPAIETGRGGSYGYHWYCDRFEYGSGSRHRAVDWIGAIGNGDQRLFIVPELDLVVAIVAGNYDLIRQGTMPAALLTEFILPAIS